MVALKSGGNAGQICCCLRLSSSPPTNTVENCQTSNRSPDVKTQPPPTKTIANHRKCTYDRLDIAAAIICAQWHCGGLICGAASDGARCHIDKLLRPTVNADDDVTIGSIFAPRSASPPQVSTYAYAACLHSRYRTQCRATENWQ